MADPLEVITRIITEHHTSREHIKLVGDSVNDIEAFFTLQRVQSSWTQSSITSLMEQKNRMQQAINFLDEGLKNHFAFEEKVMPSLFGELLTKAILHEHLEISGQIESAKITLASMKLEEVEQRDILIKKSQIQGILNQLCQKVEQHAQHEEIILNMIKRALEEGA